MSVSVLQGQGPDPPVLDGGLEEEISVTVQESNVDESDYMEMSDIDSGDIYEEMEDCDSAILQESSIHANGDMTKSVDVFEYPADKRKCAEMSDYDNKSVNVCDNDNNRKYVIMFDNENSPGVNHFVNDNVQPSYQPTSTANRSTVIVPSVNIDIKVEPESPPCYEVLENEQQHIKIEPLEFEPFPCADLMPTEATCDKAFEYTPDEPSVSQHSFDSMDSHINMAKCNSFMKSEPAELQSPKVPIKTEVLLPFSDEATGFKRRQKSFNAKRSVGICSKLTHISVKKCTFRNCKHKGLPNPFVKLEPLAKNQRTVRNQCDLSPKKSRLGRVIKNTQWKRDYNILLSNERTVKRNVSRKNVLKKIRFFDKNYQVYGSKVCNLSAPQDITYVHSSELANHPTDGDTLLAKAIVNHQLEADQKALMSVPVEDNPEICKPVYLIKNKHFDESSDSNHFSKIPVPGIFEESGYLELNHSNIAVSKENINKQNFDDSSERLKPWVPLNVNNKNDSDVDIEEEWDSSVYRAETLEKLQQEEHNYSFKEVNESKKPNTKKKTSKNDSKKGGSIIKLKGQSLKGMDSMAKSQEEKDGELSLEIIGDFQGKILYPSFADIETEITKRHNLLERRRRSEMRNLFIQLHEAITGQELDVPVEKLACVEIGGTKGSEMAVLKQAKRKIYLLELESMKLTLIKKSQLEEVRRKAMYIYDNSAFMGFISQHVCELLSKYVS